MNTHPKVPMTRVVICVYASRANLASPKSETCNIKNMSTKIWIYIYIYIAQTILNFEFVEW